MRQLLVETGDLSQYLKLGDTVNMDNILCKESFGLCQG